MHYHLVVRAEHSSAAPPAHGRVRAPATLRLCATLALAAAFALAIAYAWTHCPWWDEGLFSDVALNFRNTAHLRSSLLAPNSYVNLPAPDRATYWQFPAYLIGLGAWLRIVPVSIYSVRLFSVLWGGVFVVSWFVFVRAFSRNESLSLLAAVAVGFDYSVISAASDGRMDMMCAALGMAALALYAKWRVSPHTRTALLTGLCAAASLFSHPMGLVMNACLLALVLCDWRKLHWRFALSAVIPYVVFGIAWTLYILQDPPLFLAQMKAISGYRVGGILFTLRSMLRDLPDRYLHFYFAPRGGLHRLKIFIPLFGLAGLLMLVGNQQWRAQPLVRRLILMLAVAFLGVAAVDDMKFPYYLVYVMPMLAALGATSLYQTFSSRSALRYVAASLGLAFLGANAADCLYYIHRNDFANEYRPAVATIRQLRQPGDIIMGPSELGYAFGFQLPLIDDCYLGYHSGIKPRLYVMYSSCNPPPGDKQPWIWSREQLAANYREMYRNPAYTIYLRNSLLPAH